MPSKASSLDGPVADLGAVGVGAGAEFFGLGSMAASPVSLPWSAGGFCSAGLSRDPEAEGGGRSRRILLRGSAVLTRFGGGGGGDGGCEDSATDCECACECESESESEP